MNPLLSQFISSNLVLLTDEVVNEFVVELEKKYSNSIQAVIFYGSCMRERNYQAAVLDFYVIVDSYRDAYQKWGPIFLNKLLPPNVFFIQVDVAGQEYQAKYALVSRRDLSKYTSQHAFHSYFWARFAQPIALVFVRDETVKQWLVSAQEQAITTLLRKVRCMLSSEFSSQELWTKALRLTYAAELRAEPISRADTIYKNSCSYYDGITEVVRDQITNNQKANLNKFLCSFLWKLRIGLGKLLSVARLLKATFTFSNGVDYIAWKIKKHTGEKIVVTDRLRKYPWIFCWPLLWRLVRSGNVR